MTSDEPARDTPRIARRAVTVVGNRRRHLHPTGHRRTPPASPTGLPVSVYSNPIPTTWRTAHTRRLLRHMTVRMYAKSKELAGESKYD